MLIFWFDIYCVIQAGLISIAASINTEKANGIDLKNEKEKQIQIMPIRNTNEELDWKLLHQVFFHYPEDALYMDTDLVIQSVSAAYLAHIKPPIQIDDLIGTRMIDILEDRVTDIEAYMKSLHMALATESTTTYITLDTEGSQYTLETTPLRNHNHKIYGLRHRIQHVIKHDADTYLQILRDTSDQDTWKIMVNSIKEYAIFVVSINSKIQTWNVNCENTYGWKHNEIIGMPYRVIAPEHKQDSFSSILSITESTHLKKDDTTFISEEQIFPIHSHGVLVGFAVMSRDLTTGKSTEKLLLQAREDSQIIQRNFLASISHESRSSAAIIISTLEQILRTAMTTEQKEMCDDMYHASRLLLQSVDDILEYASFQQNGVKLKHEKFQLPNAIQKIVKVHKRELENLRGNRVDLLEFQSPKLPIWLIGDEVRVVQIFNNLLSNAIKFTDSGYIKLKVLDCEEMISDFVCMKIIVEDTGCGIANNQIPFLFDPFYQTDSSWNRQQTGTGLGLANLKMIVETMHGDIEVKSNLHFGSTFTCVIHIQKYSSKPPSPLRGRSYNLEQNVLDNHVLVVEDNHMLARITMRHLSKIGMKKVDWVEDGKCAIDFVKGNPAVDLVFMDLQMPKVSGLDATRQIRKFNEDVIIIALTANAMEADKELCKTAGMNDFLAKPVSLMDIKNILLRYLCLYDNSK